jgi:hypothetical protein
MLDFKAFLEMAHLIPRRNGVLNPIYIGGNFAQGIDFKFETVKLKKTLLSIVAKFFGKLPKENNYLIFDGKTLDVGNFPPAKDEGYIELPDYWFDLALIEFVDGSSKEPKSK